MFCPTVAVKDKIDCPRYNFFFLIFAVTLVYNTLTIVYCYAVQPLKKQTDFLTQLDPVIYETKLNISMLFSDPIAVTPNSTHGWIILSH